MPEPPKPSVETAPGRRSTSSAADRALLAIFAIAIVLVVVGALVNFALGSVGLAAPSPSEAPQATPISSHPAPAPGATVGPGHPVSVRASWEANAQDYRGRIGVLVDYDCLPGGVPQRVWGTDTYTDDSSVCTAAVHAGEITLEAGGLVWIRIAPGQLTYDASERNGILTESYLAWDGSFTVVPGL